MKILDLKGSNAIIENRDIFNPSSKATAYATQNGPVVPRR